MEWDKDKDFNFECECVECGNQVNSMDRLNAHILWEHAWFKVISGTSVGRNIALSLSGRIMRKLRMYRCRTNFEEIMD